MINLISQGIRGAGTAINVGSARVAIERLGQTLPSAALPAAFYGRDRHDAAEMGFDMGWDSGCACMRYLSAARHIP